MVYVRSRARWPWSGTLFLFPLLALSALVNTARAELPLVGVNAGAPIWSGSVLFTDSLAADIAGSGCRTVRINFRIDGHSTWTPSHLANYDQIIETARSHNLQVLGILAYESVAGGQADWNENWDTTGMNDYILNFADTAYMLVDRYKDDVKLFEIWNEPDCWSVPPSSNPLQPGCFYIWPRNYANVLAETYKRCLTLGGSDFFATNGISLCSAGLFGHDIGGSFSPSMTDYMNIVYQQDDIWDVFETVAGRRYPWDFFGYHFYLNQGSAVSTSELDSFFNNVRFWKSHYADSAPIMVTEFGWRSTAVGEQLQADNLTDAYDWLRAQEDVVAAYWYQWNDGDGGWGLVFSIGNPKLSYFAFAEQCGDQPPPTAKFQALPLAGPAPLDVQFLSTSIGLIDTYQWDFGDSSTSDERDPQHEYASPGTYTVSLTVFGPGGSDTETKVDFVQVTVPPNPADLDHDGDADLADWSLFAACFTGAGQSGVPPGCEGVSTTLPPATSSYELVGGMGGLSASISGDDLLHGVIGVVEQGGFHSAVPGGTAGGLADLTDGLQGGGLEAVLGDYLRPSLHVRYELAAPRAIDRIHVFASNSDGRVFQNYDLEYSTVGDSSFQPLLPSVTTGPFGQVNAGVYGASLTRVVSSESAPIALDVDALCFTFYDVSTVSPPDVFWDAYDAEETGDSDGQPRAYVASIIKEIDVFEYDGPPLVSNRADLDGDGDADLDDLRVLVSNLTGP